MITDIKHTGSISGTVTCDNCGRKLRKIAKLYNDGMPSGVTFVMEDKTHLTFCRFCLEDLGNNEFVPMSDKVKAIWKEDANETGCKDRDNK